MTQAYDAILLVSFGGPEGMADVMPFLENVTRGRNIPRERLAQVAHHYELFGGVSPLNAQNRDLVAALEAELAAHDIRLPVYWGNRNWQPLLPDALREMRDDGVRRALGLVTSAYSSYSSCRQYRENIAQAQDELGHGAPAVDKLRTFHNHPGFIRANAEALQASLDQLPPERRAAAHVAFTAHSIPQAMAERCDYEAQLLDTAGLVAAAVGIADWALVWQSRSGPPTQPWLEPDILDHLAQLHNAGVTEVVLSPIGFISDHMEVLYDLDTEARSYCAGVGMTLLRAATAGTHPAFVAMLRELVQERLDPALPRRALGLRGAGHDVCPVDCCLMGPGRPPALPAALPTAPAP
jgi:ferrochelatase